jgi:hypothetical protein
MPTALLVAQMADNAFASTEAIEGVMPATGQIGPVRQSIEGPDAVPSK